MTNVPKPDLQRGAYIVYTDEPGEILSPGSTGGGGGAVFLEADFVQIGSPLVPKFSFNDVKNALDAGKAVFVKWTTDNGTGLVTASYMSVVQLTTDKTPGDESYVVAATDGSNAYSFSATDPSKPMTDNSH